MKPASSVNITLHSMSSIPVSELPVINKLYQDILELYYGGMNSLTIIEVSAIVKRYNLIAITNPEIGIIGEELELLIECAYYPQTIVN